MPRKKKESLTQDVAVEAKGKREYSSIKVKRELMKELKIFAGEQDVNNFAASVLKEYIDRNLLTKKQELENQLRQIEAKLNRKGTE